MSAPWVAGLVALLGVSAAWAAYEPPSLLIDAAGSRPLPAGGPSYGATISDDGRFVAYASRATNLVADDSEPRPPMASGNLDVYLYDASSGTNSLVSVASDGTKANRNSSDPAISGDGRFVAFLSWATNLVDGDTNGVSDVFVHDRDTGQTTRVSVSSAGVQAAAPGVSGPPAISADGRYVAFVSSAANLVPGDTNALEDTFVHDRLTGLTERVSVSSSGAQGRYGHPISRHPNFNRPALSADGRFVAFESMAEDLVPDDRNDRVDVFVHDRVTGETERVSTTADGGEADGESRYPAISADGRFVAFSTNAGNMDASFRGGLFVHDRDTGRTERVGVSSAGVPAIGQGLGRLSISADGRHVAFHSYADNLVDDDTNGVSDLFTHDRETGLTERLAVGMDGAEPDGDSYAPAISADGRYVAFSSIAANLYPGDVWQDDAGEDVLLHDRRTAKTTVISSPGREVSTADDDNIDPSISADGRFVAFVSSASNLVDMPLTTQVDRVYVLDRATDRIESVSVDVAGVPASGKDPVISADGRFVAFMSGANNLVDGDTSAFDIFVRDLVLGTTERVSVDSRGRQANRMTIGTYAGSLMPTISADGRHVAFISAASNFSDIDGDRILDVFVHDRATGETVLASVSSTGEAANGHSYVPLIAGDGSFVVFESYATNLVDDDTNGRGDLFLRDLVNGTTERLSVAPGGSELPGGSTSFGRMSSSADGRFIAFGWDGDGLVAGDSDGLLDVFVYDRTLRRIEQISTNINRSLAGDPVISGDGRYVAFLAATWYLVPGSPLGRMHQVFVYDRATGETTRVSENAAGVPSNGLDVGVGQTPPAISGDGRVIVFTTEATNLDPADVNGEADLYEVVLAVDPANRPPVADAGEDRVLACSGPKTAVTLDGSGSFDPEGEALVYRWTGVPDPADVIAPVVSLGVGVHEFVLAVDDGSQVGPVDSVRVTVRDEVPPSLSGLADRVVEANVPDGATVAFDQDIVDACDPAPTYTVDPPGPYPIGVTAVSVTARDASGNTASRTLGLMVVDTTPPVLIAPPPVAVRPSGTLTPVVLGMPRVSDLVGPVTVDNDAPAAGFPVGDSVVTWTAVDAAGNRATAQQVVSVSETVFASGPKLRQGRVDAVDDRWRTVSLPTTYVNPVIVASVQVEAGQLPTVPRVRNVAPDRFELSVQEPSGRPLTEGYRVYYLVVESGVYTEAVHGVRMEAGRVATVGVDGRANGWTGMPLAYGNAYAAPVVLGQVMSANDARWSVFWAAGAERRAAPDGLAFTLGRHVGDDPDPRRQPEQVGYIVIEAGSGVLDGLAYEAGISEAEVTGRTGVRPGQTVAHGLGRVSAGVVASAGMRGRDGGWPVLHGAAPLAGGGVDVVIAEDQLSDEEVAHQAERVAYVVVGADAPVSHGPLLHHGRLDAVGDDWQTVILPRSYADPVVVATVQYDDRQLPAVVRVRHVAGDRIELRVQNPGDALLTPDYSVHYLVAEAGVYNEADHGIRMEAVRYLSGRTDGKRSGWTGEARAYANAYAEPVVLGQVMSANDERWSTFWARGADRRSVPDAEVLWTGKHVGEDPDTDRAAETIGYIVIEAGTGSSSGRAFEAGVSGRVAAGTRGSPPYPLPHALTTVRGAILSPATMRGSDGGWPVLYGVEPLLPLMLEVAFDEDQLEDEETAHRPENLGYLVVE